MNDNLDELFNLPEDRYGDSMINTTHDYGSSDS